MSVNTSEEYLDELLQAIEPIINMGQPEAEELPKEEEPVFAPEIPADSALFDETGGDGAMDDILASLAEQEYENIDEEVMSEEDVDSILNVVGNQTPQENTEASYDEDVKELLKHFTDDEDLSDIQDILEKNDNGEALDNAMLDVPDVEVFQLEEEDDGEEEKENKPANPFGKILGGFSGLFKKRKKKKQEDINDELPPAEEGYVSLEEAGEEEIADTDMGMGLAEMDDISLEDLFGDEDVLELDEDLSDIEQLLSGGTFEEEEIATVADVSDSQAVTPNKKKSKKGGKESFFSKIFNMLTEEIDETGKSDDTVPEAGKTGVTQENLNILEELSAEDKKKAKQAKKEERQKKKEEKKGKAASKKEAGKDEDVEAEDKQSKKPKKLKKKREKKEKPRKVEVITKPEKKLPRKRVMSILALCFSILAAVLILQNVVFRTDNFKEAKYAFDNGDYATCFANLEAVERDEEEEELYRKSMIIMSVQRKWDAYNNYVMMDNRLEALNSLLEGVAEYRSLEDTALEWGVHAQIAVIYQDILEALQGYGLSQADADEILAYESKVTYTKRLDSIVNGTPFVIEDSTQGTDISQPQPLQDVLPGEADFLPDDTTLINEPSAITELPEEKPAQVQDKQTSGETVVVGSEPVVTGGQNVGSGNTNLSSEVTGQNVLIGIN